VLRFEHAWGVWCCRFHDFAITKNYAVFMHMPLVFDPSIMVKVRARQQAGLDASGPVQGCWLGQPACMQCLGLLQCLI